ncbi:TetR/AcrR family transcriptional regulator [Jannaschia sp. M317]|uniref:TetR/AcrR family transcriptional regulator n=1 Tax=Jannaschia sp. M317 TaxID=2867011 RepID=UPI0021A941CF|nr:TetR/AcrR family transcriptional regulator [Jannaschia sp. M317]UWQ17837.1 TetR/AcrR family transcriptional regulator [Jannaschia sp. M317]
MKDTRRKAREAQIEQAAYEVIEAKGYAGTSMLAVARRARASNETLYNWYGDKQGLFRALVQRNAQEVTDHLAQAIAGSEDPADAILVDVGALLLGLVAGQRAVALNRAAAADPTGALGALIAQGGRDTVAPMLGRLIAQVLRRSGPAQVDAAAATALFLDLLIGDLQIRRVIGQADMPDADTRRARAIRAVRMMRLAVAEGLLS